MNIDEMLAKTNLWNVLFFLWRCTKFEQLSTHKLRYLIYYAVSISVFASLFGLFIPIVFRNAIFVFAIFPELEIFFVAIFSYCLIYVTYQLIIYIGEIIFVPLARKLAMELIYRVFTKLFAPSFLPNMQDPYLITRILTRSIESISKIINAIFIHSVAWLCEICVISIFVSYTYSWYIGLLIIGCTMFFIVATIICLRQIVLPNYALLLDADGYLYDFVVSRLAHLNVVCDKEALYSQITILRSLLCASEIYGTRYDVSVLKLLLLQRIIICGYVIAAIAITGYFVAHKTLTSGDILLIYGYILQVARTAFAFGNIAKDLLPALINLSNIKLLLQQELHNVHDIKTILNTKFDPQAQNDLFCHGFKQSLSMQSFAHSFANGTIKIENVFYQIGALSMNNLNMFVLGGTKVCIVGETGSGKSVLCDLMTNIRDAERGLILIDGQEVKAWRQHHWTKIGILANDSDMFYDTIENNVTLADKRFDLSDVIELAEIFSIHDKIMQLSDLYNTKISNNSNVISSYEFLIVILMRILIRKPQIIIIDREISCRELPNILYCIKYYLPDVTVVICTRDAKISSLCDYTYVVHKGAIVQRGHYHYLCHYDGLYKTMLSKISSSS